MVLSENLGGYITVAQRFVAYLDRRVPDAELVRMAQAISALREQPGMGNEYNAFLFRVALQWSYRRIAKHFSTNDRTVRRRITRARRWILEYLEGTQAA